MNAFLPIGVVLQGFVAACVAQAFPDIGPFAAGLEATALAGMALMAWRRSRGWGARVVMVASLPFVPLGFLAVYGALREIDRLTEEQFQRAQQKGSP